jgi:hypothetical protein
MVPVSLATIYHKSVRYASDQRPRLNSALAGLTNVEAGAIAVALKAEDFMRVREVPGT